jgi:hypothetical protein
MNGIRGFSRSEMGGRSSGFGGGMKKGLDAEEGDGLEREEKARPVDDRRVR